MNFCLIYIIFVKYKVFNLIFQNAKNRSKTQTFKIKKIPNAIRISISIKQFFKLLHKIKHQNDGLIIFINS